MKYYHFVVVIGYFHCQSAKTPLGTVLIINLLGKGLAQGLVYEIKAPGHAHDRLLNRCIYSLLLIVLSRRLWFPLE